MEEQLQPVWIVSIWVTALIVSRVDDVVHKCVRAPSANIIWTQLRYSIKKSVGGI